MGSRPIGSEQRNPGAIGPIAFRHTNFQGIYRFPLERYPDRLLPSAMPPKVAVGAK
jgi:hypothetical protein